jgi:hypothetical protein
MDNDCKLDKSLNEIAMNFESESKYISSRLWCFIWTEYPLDYEKYLKPLMINSIKCLFQPMLCNETGKSFLQGFFYFESANAYYIIKKINNIIHSSTSNKAIKWCAGKVSVNELIKYICENKTKVGAGNYKNIFTRNRNIPIKKTTSEITATTEITAITEITATDKITRDITTTEELTATEIINPKRKRAENTEDNILPLQSAKRHQLLQTEERAEILFYNWFQEYSDFTKAFIHNKSVSGYSTKRPDFHGFIGFHFIIIEIDENQHRTYDQLNEEKRMIELSYAIHSTYEKHRTFIIRLNPDVFKTFPFGPCRHISLENRRDYLFQILEQFNILGKIVDHPWLTQFEKQGVYVLYLYYDGFIEETDITRLCFEFIDVPLAKQMQQQQKQKQKQKPITIKEDVSVRIKQRATLKLFQDPEDWDNLIS